MSGREIIRQAIESGRFDMAELSRTAMRNSAYIQQFLKRNTPLELPEHLRETLAPFLGVTPDDLRETPRGGPASQARQQSLVADSRPVARDAGGVAFEFPVIGSMPRDVPVFGSAQGGEDGAFELNMMGEPVDRVRRPPGLLGMPNVFAIYVEGDSMSPWRRSGQFVYVHQTRPPGIGDYVIVVVPRENKADPPLAYLKLLERRTADKIIVSQYNPPKELTFPKHEGVKVLRVIDWDEALGV